jgi:hypothetical protein
MVWLERNIVKKSKGNRFKIIAIFVAIFTGLVFGFSIFLARKQTAQNAAVPTLEAAQSFFDVHFQKLLTEMFPSGAYHFSELQQQYDRNVLRIKERYGAGYRFDVVNQYSPLSPFITTACGMKEAVPYVQVFMPSLMELYKVFKRTGGTDEQFQTSFVIDFLHELDHIALGLLPRDGETAPWVKRVDNERLTWAETCEYTLRPLLEIHRLKIEVRHFDAYTAWLKCARNPDSEVWRAFITGVYK